LFGINKTDERKEDCLAGRSFDNGGLSNSRGIKVNVGTFFCGFGSWVKVQKFNNVANQVR
jgi:hypothetical protein